MGVKVSFVSRVEGEQGADRVGEHQASRISARRCMTSSYVLKRRMLAPSSMARSSTLPATISTGSSPCHSSPSLSLLSSLTFFPLEFSYASLIVFANYLLEKSASLSDDTDTEEEEGGAASRMKPFKEWLADRREISHILSRKTLE